MSDRSKPIYNLTPNTINYLFACLESNGYQYIGSGFNPGDIPITTKNVERYIPAGKYTISETKAGKKRTKVINIYEFKNGLWLYSTPLYTLRKVNGKTHRSVNDSSFVFPSNAISIYQLTVSWEDDLTLDSLNLEVVRYV